MFNRYTDELQAFGLVTNSYQPLTIEGYGIWLEEAQLGLGLWQGSYAGIDRLWLRWYDRDQNWILTPTEKEKKLAEQEKFRTEQEKTRAEQEKLRADQEKVRADSA